MTLSIILMVYGLVAVSYGFFLMGVEAGERRHEGDGGVSR